MTTRRAPLRIPVVAVTIAIAAVVVGACGSDDDNAGPATTSADASSTTSSGAPGTDTTDTTLGVTTTEYVPDTTRPPETAPPGPVVITVTVGVDSGPTRVERVTLGDTVTLVVTNPTSADEFHLHGYDLGDGQEVPAGQAASFTFTASQAGEFELESHETDAALMVLVVE
jgi:hypothetical protein